MKRGGSTRSVGNGCCSPSPPCPLPQGVGERPDAASRQGELAAPSPCCAASTCSSACATSSTRASEPRGPMTWMPKGMPAWSTPQGIAAAQASAMVGRVGDGEPAHVGRHLLAVDLLHEELRVRERRHRCCRADQDIDILEEGDEACASAWSAPRARGPRRRGSRSGRARCCRRRCGRAGRAISPAARDARRRNARRAAPRTPRARR